MIEKKISLGIIKLKWQLCERMVFMKIITEDMRCRKKLCEYAMKN